MLQGRLIHGIGVDELILRAGDKAIPIWRLSTPTPRRFFYDRAA